MQDRIIVDGWSAKQPTSFEWRFATTSTEDSTRTMSGRAVITPLFTVEAFDVEYEELTPSEARDLLHAIVQRAGHVYFPLHYYSPYYGNWRTANFYVGDGSLKVRTLEEGAERMHTVTCTFVGKEKLC